MSTEGPTPRRDIDETTAARLAEIFAVAERAARSVIDEAEEEALARLDAAQEEADRILAARLAGLSALTDEIDAQAEALRVQAEALQQALARARAQIAGTPRPVRGGTPVVPGPAPAAPPPSTPALTVVADAPAPPAEPAPAPLAPPAERSGAVASPQLPDPQAIGSAAGARLLATQMAVAGSSRAEIDARLREGFGLADPGPILDAILGPEQ